MGITRCECVFFPSSFGIGVSNLSVAFSASVLGFFYSTSPPEGELHIVWDI